MNSRRIAAIGVATFATVAALTFHLPPAAAAPSVFGLRYMASSNQSTSVSWFKAEEASTYKVYVNGTLVRTVTDPQLTTTIELPQMLGPKDVVTAEALSADGTVGETMRATYQYLYPPYDVFIPMMTIDFSRGEHDLDEGAVAHVKQLVAELQKHGFQEVRLIGHNAVLVGTYNALTMAAARAEAVSAALSSDMTIPITIQTHAVKVTKGSADSIGAREVEVSVR